MRILFFTLFSMSVVSFAQGSDFDSYYVDSVTFKSQLLLDHCPDELDEAIRHVMENALGALNEQNLIAILPNTIGHKYFTLEFRAKTGPLVMPLDVPIFYEFQYWSDWNEDDTQSKPCTRIEPEDFVY